MDTFSTQRAYGQGALTIRGGFMPYGSTAGGSAPLIPTIAGQDPTGGSRPKFAGFWVAHDGSEAARHQVTLDNDYQDLIVLPEVEVNRNVTPSTLFVGSTTAGSGVLISAPAAGSPGVAGALTQPLVSVAAASGGAGTTASVGYVVATGALIITAKTSATNATVAAALNAWATYSGTAPTALLLNAVSVGNPQDIFYVGAYTWYFGGPTGTNSEELGYASLFLQSLTTGDGVLYTAVQPGEVGDAISIIYVYSATGANPAVTVVGSNISIAIDNTGSTVKDENYLIVAAIVASAQASALVTAQVVSVIGAYPNATQYNTARTDHQGTGHTNENFLTGGGLPFVCVSGKPNPQALADSGIQNLEQLQASQKLALPGIDPYSHFSLRTYIGDTPTDLSAAAQLFVPSATQGSGIMFNSVATAATAATVAILSTSGAGVGVTYTAIQPGAAGNNISIVYLNSLATLLIPSTTAGSGVTFTANSQYTGTAGQAISVSMAAPNASITVANVVVQGLAITIYPQSGASGGADTNTSIVTAVQGSPAAAQLVSVATTGTASDLVTGNFNAHALGGGYTQASGSASASMSGTPTTGYAISVQFGTNATNAQVETAVNLVNGNSSTATTIGAQAVVKATALSTTTDHVVVTGATFLTGGSDPSSLGVLYASPLGATLTVTVAGNAGTLTVNTTQYFPVSGTLDIINSAGNTIAIAYTGKTGTTFTGCTGGLSTYNFNSGVVAYADAPLAVLSSGSIQTTATAQTFSGTITVASTSGFASSGTFYVEDTQGNVNAVAYTATTATTFTTCTGYISGNLLAAGAIVASAQGSLTTIYLGFTATNNTNAALVTAFTEAQWGPSPALYTAVPVGTSSDLNSIEPAGSLNWGTTNTKVNVKNLQCDNMIRFIVMARNSPAIGP